MLPLRLVTTARLPAGCVALMLVVTGASSSLPGYPPLLAAAPSHLSLKLNLASSQELSAMTTGVMVAEVNRIWWASHLSLIWRSGDVSEPVPPVGESTDSLRVLILATPATGLANAATLTVGELVRHQGVKPLAIASVTAARRIVEESQRRQTLNGSRDYDRRLGVVLGRAVAHEIGHYLLRTSTHASQGLMRASIDAAEFADVRSQSFGLDEEAQAHLARLASMPHSQPLLFSYASR